MNHTKEPWNVREMGDDCFITAAIEPGMTYGPEIMGDDYTGYGGSERRKADARRIVACVNACAGISTDELESEGSAVMGLNRTARKLIDVAKQLDDMLAATELLLSRKRPGTKEDDPRLIREIDCLNLEDAIAIVKANHAS